MAGRSFFTKARGIVRAPKVPKPKPPNHKRKCVVGVRRTGSGSTEHKFMSSRKAAQVLGGQKGGLVSAALGTAHRWTSESARKAAIKSWTKRRKFNRRIMARVGMVSKKRASLWREPLRAYYAENPTRGIRYVPKVWSDQAGPEIYSAWLGPCWLRTAAGVTRSISERAALTALGHLKSSRGYIPDSITPTRRHSDKD